MSSIYTPRNARGWQRRRSLLVRFVGPLLVLASSTGLSGQDDAAVGSASTVAEQIRNRLEAARATGDMTVAGSVLTATRALPAFYLERMFRPVWSGDEASVRRAHRVVEALRNAPEDGLVAEDYHLAAIEALMGPRPEGAGERVRRRVDLDLLLTDAFLVFGSHLLHGRINPETVEPEWTANRRNVDMAEVLRRALEGDSLVETLHGLRPPQARYARLRAALSRYREMARQGGWPRVSEGPKLEPGSRDPRIAALRARLRASGDLAGSSSGSPAPTDPELYDAELEAAVRSFQARHGLDVDGVVGQGTVGALNVPVEARIRQLEVNMERWRWLPQDLGRRHVEVNIAGFGVDVVEGVQSVLHLRAVVGRTYRQTPSFTGRMTHLVFSPTWHVPPGIAANDKLPELKRRDGAYLAEQHMTLLERDSDRPVDPASVDFSTLTGLEFNRRYRIRQAPGPWNALGGVKFMFPNAYNVYLHDTPSRELFERSQRSFSSGCIRIQNPARLAEYLLGGDPQWTPERIKTAMEQEREQLVRLPEPLPVHLLYWTAWVDAEGVVHFREDIYGRDTTVARALAEHLAEE